MVDPQGRVVIVHGLDLVDKRKPYVPPNGPTGFTKRDAAWLARHGTYRRSGHFVLVRPSSTRAVSVGIVRR